MPTQNVNLTSELDSFVKAQIASGSFNNASEVHRAALAAMAKEDEERQLRLDLLRRELALGVDDLESGQFLEVSTEKEHQDFFSRIRETTLESQA